VLALPKIAAEDPGASLGTITPCPNAGFERIHARPGVAAVR
jgi:hypothetical protein